MINASSRSIRLVIGGIDLSDYLASFEVQDSDNGQGLITQQGQITLVRVVDAVVDLNDRTNPSFWQRGQRVELDAANSTLSLTRLKTLRILQASYDPATLTQTVQVGCKLKLIDFPVVRDCEIKPLDVVLGGSKTKTELINGFLSYFDLDPMVGTVPDSINYPIIGDSESLAQLAGRLAYNAGYALWVDQQENIIPVSRRLSDEGFGEQ